MIGARGPSANSVNAISAAAVVFTSPATAKFACSVSASERSTVPTSTADCSATVAASHTTSARALHAAMAMQARSMPCPAGPELRDDRAQQQGEEQHAAECHRLRGDGQTVDDDRQIAEQIDQQRHASMPCDREGYVATGDMAVDRQHLPAHDIGAGVVSFTLASSSSGGPDGVIFSTDWLWSGLVSVRRERARSIRLL